MSIKINVILILLVFSVFVVFNVWAAGKLGTDTDKRQVYDFMPSVFGTLTATKTDMTLDTSTIHAVRIQPTVAVTLKLNGAGTAWPIAANTVQEYRIPAGVTSYVFSAASSASNKVHYQTE